jgi:hypothetical protein
MLKELKKNIVEGMVKLKSYCCEYLGRHLSVKTVHSVLDQASPDLKRIRTTLIRLKEQTFNPLIVK